MIKSFLNFLLPDDEYKRIRIVYFIAEAAVILAVVLLLYTLFTSWLDLQSRNGFVIAVFSFFFIMMYTFIRYIFSGMEHTNVVSREQFVKKRIRILGNALGVGLVFFVLNLIFEGIPSNREEAMDIIGPTIFFIVFYLLFDYISLKRSYKKNKELLDD